MKKTGLLIIPIIFSQAMAVAQLQPSVNNVFEEMYFVSDTQQPMFVEKLVLKSNHNQQATSDIFSSIEKQRPKNVYMLGDVVSLGFANRKWKRVDQFLATCRSEGTDVCAVLGNHEVMGRRVKGEKNFQKRFPMNVRTGYVSVTDSVAVVLLNSNFNALSAADINKQLNWYKTTLEGLDQADSIKAVIVTCHHAPFTNSKIVKCSDRVQENFVPDFIQSKKAKLFITGHAHAFEHFKMMGKDFFVIGGGGGLHQPLDNNNPKLTDLASGYKPMFHYLSVKRMADELVVTSHYLKNDFSGFETGYSSATSESLNTIAGFQDKAGKKNN